MVVLGFAQRGEVGSSEARLGHSRSSCVGYPLLVQLRLQLLRLRQLLLQGIHALRLQKRVGRLSQGLLFLKHLLMKILVKRNRKSTEMCQESQSKRTKRFHSHTKHIQISVLHLKITLTFISCTWYPADNIDASRERSKPTSSHSLTHAKRYS